MFPAFRMVDTCHTNAYIPYFYSSYTGENSSRLTDKKKIIVLGAGPIRIGQGVEFDYSTVHAVTTIKNSGYEAIIINNNPETVSTDYTCSDKLYFEPLTVEDVMNIVEHEKPDGVIASLGGQTAINLAAPLAARGVKIIGTGSDNTDHIPPSSPVRRMYMGRVLCALLPVRGGEMTVTATAPGLKGVKIKIDVPKDKEPVEGRVYPKYVIKG